MAKVLVVEDDVNLALSIRDWLVLENNRVDVAFDGAEALDSLSHREYDILILDLNLPVVRGVDVCKRYRSSGGEARILVLTGRADLHDKTLGFDAGADDYVCKPCDVREISLRIKALMRRTTKLINSNLKIADIEIDQDSRRVMRAQQEISLMPQEYTLLEFLARHPNKLFDAEYLGRRLWPGRSSNDTVRTHIKTLRKKLEVPGKESLIKTVHGVGYALVCD